MIATKNPSPNHRHPLSDLPPRILDLSIGALQFGIPVPVSVSSRLLEDYAEIQPVLGLNVVGVVLSLVSYRWASLLAVINTPETVTACLLRRRDGCVVELDLEILSVGLSGRRSLLLRITDERVLPF
jgi:hypothetical protein